MDGYYTQRLSAERLRRCYEIAPPRVVQYLEAEVRHVVERIRLTDIVLELGCGYGRALAQLAEAAATVVGIDTSLDSLRMAAQVPYGRPNCRLALMDAGRLGFRDGVFDMVVCIQNGISAFKVDRRQLLAETLRVTRTGGRVLVSSYSDHFWPDRLEWFRLQSEEGLVGEIDWRSTGDGEIVCQDGFKATTVRPADFRALTAGLHAECRIEEVDESSVFCELVRLQGP